MTTVLHVSGDADFAAMNIEDDYGVMKAYEAAVAAGGYAEIELDCETAYVTVKEFGEVDPEFIDFIRAYVQDDYEQTKATNFFIIEEDE